MSADHPGRPGPFAESAGSVTDPQAKRLPPSLYEGLLDHEVAAVYADYARRAMAEERIPEICRAEVERLDAEIAELQAERRKQVEEAAAAPAKAAELALRAVNARAELARRLRGG